MGRAIINAPPPPTTLYPQKQYDPSSHKVRRVACMIFKNARIIKGIEKHAQVEVMDWKFYVKPIDILN